MPGQGDQIREVLALAGALHPVGLHLLVGLPQRFGGPLARGPLDCLGQLHQLRPRDPLPIGLGIQHTQGIQLVAVLAAVGLEFTGEILGGALVIEVLVRPRSGEGHLVGGEHIHGDLLGLAHREQRLAELGVAGQGLGCFIEELRAGLLALVFCGDLHGGHRKQFTGPLFFLVGIQAIEYMTHQIPQGRSAGHLGQLGFLLGGEASLHPIQAASQGREHVFVAVAHSHQLQQLRKRH